MSLLLSYFINVPFIINILNKNHKLESKTGGEYLEHHKIFQLRVPAQNAYTDKIEKKKKKKKDSINKMIM